MEALGMSPRQLDRLADHADVAAPHASVPNQSGRDELRGVGRNRETNTLRAGDDRGVHADDLGAGIHQGAARVTGIQRRVRLNDAVDEPPGLRAHRAAKRAHDARGHRGLKAERVADRDHELALANAPGIA